MLILSCSATVEIVQVLPAKLFQLTGQLHFLANFKIFWFMNAFSSHI